MTHTLPRLLAATLLLAAPAANACQLVCVVTNKTYSGDLKNTAPAGPDGLKGADAKCAAEFPGFKFARSATFLANISNGNLGGNTAAMGDKIYYNAGSNSPFIRGIDAPPLNGGSVNMGWNADIIMAVPGNTSTVSPFNTLYSVAWAHHGGYNCTNWTDNSNSYAGWTGGNQQQQCNTSRPLVCCNM